MFGAMSENMDELQDWQQNRVNYNIWSDVPIKPPPPDQPPPDQPVTQSTSSVKSGDVISGSGDWVVTTDQPAAAVEFFADNQKLEKVTGPGKAFVHKYDSTKLPDGAHQVGWHVLDDSGAVVWRSPAVDITITQGEEEVSTDVKAAAIGAWKTKQKIQTEINRMQDQGRSWTYIRKNLGATSKNDPDSFTWEIWQIVKDVKDPGA
jgi:hypothetical protein